jgi:MoxR-like ATPase
MALPYAAFPKYGPSVLGQAKYDTELQAWELYQASLRNPGIVEFTPEDGAESDESDEPGGDLDTFTYLRKYVKPGQSRKRIFREQNIKALDADHALRQGRDAMVGELGKRFEDSSGISVENWTPVPGSEKAVKPRGKAFQQGEDDRRNEEGTNGSDGEARPDNMPANDEQGSQEDPGNAEGEADGDPGNGPTNQGDGDTDENESSQGEGEGDVDNTSQGNDQQGEDDTPKMPTCPECGERRGTTEGCCAVPNEDTGIPKPDQGPPDEDRDNLQLLRIDGEAPYGGPEARRKIERISHEETVSTLTKSLDDVDGWTRGVVKGAVHEMAVELYGAMSKSHVSLKAAIENSGGGVSKAELQRLRDFVTLEIEKAAPPEGSDVDMVAVRSEMQRMVTAAFEASDNVEQLAEKVAEKLNVARRIEVSMNGKVNEIDGTPHGAFDESLRAMTRGLDLFMVGPAGSGKGFLAQHLADALGQRFGFLSCSEGMSEGMLLGRGVPLADRFLYLQSSFVDFYENGGVFLLDEIDAANPNVLLIINECLSSPHLSIPNRVDSPYAVRHEDFYCIVAANTWGTGPDMEYVGRNRLDAAFLNRFIGSQIELGYDAKIEGAIAKAYMGPKKAEDVLKRFWGVRKKLVDLNIRRIWSTRGLEKMCIALAAGDEMHEVLNAHTRGWTSDEKSKAGVLA